MFSTPAFLDWAKKHVILVEIDFPRKTKLDDKLAKQNESLKNKFGITGFPTVLFLDANEKKIGRSGYKPGGAEKWIEDAGRQIK